MKRKNPSESFDQLAARFVVGKPQPQPHPNELHFGVIKMRPEVFQHRRPAAHISERHIRALRDAVAKYGTLEPVTVWWDGRSWVCVDGHHRMRAYLLQGKSNDSIPVLVFEGTPEAALARAASANTQDKLQMTSAEKANAAWRLVVMGEGLSKRSQAQCTGTSERQVAYMRSAKAALLEDPNIQPRALAEMTWEEARRRAVGKDQDGWSAEEEDARVEKMAMALRKALGPTAERQPGVFLKALEVYSPMLARAVEEEFVALYKAEQGLPEE